MRPRAIIIIVQTMFPNTSEHYYSRGEKVEVDHVCLGQDNLRSKLSSIPSLYTSHGHEVHDLEYP
jgi:hypothetical protein